MSLAPGVYNVHAAPFNLPTTGDDCTTLAQTMVNTAPRGATLVLGMAPLRFHIDLSARLDLALVGAATTRAGNIGASERVGSWLYPAKPGLPIITVAPSVLSQRGPTFRDFAVYAADMSVDAILVRNCNRGRIDNVSAMYGRSVVRTDGGDDCAYWHVTDCCAFQCAEGFSMNASFRWTFADCDGFAGKDQVVWSFDHNAQTVDVTGASTDGSWTDDTAPVYGHSVRIAGGAHHIGFRAFKFEATDPAVVAESGTANPSTRSCRFTDGVIGGRYGRTGGFDLGPGVEAFYIGDDVYFPNGSPAPINDRSGNITNRYPAKPILR